MKAGILKQDYKFCKSMFILVCVFKLNFFLEVG